MPTHRDMPSGWDRVAGARRAEVDAAEERAREFRAEVHRLTKPSPAELKAADQARKATSIPPPQR